MSIRSPLPPLRASLSALRASLSALRASLSALRASTRVLRGGTPLARPVDRVRAAARLLLVALVAAAVPAAVLVGAAVHGRTAAAAAAARVERSSVAATLLTAAPGVVNAGTDGATVATRATWRAASGPHEGLVQAPVGVPAGTVVPIWVDRQGRLTAAPLGSGDVAADTLAAGVLAFAAVAGVPALAYLAGTVLLDRAGVRRWERGWAAVEPVWTRATR